MGIGNFYIQENLSLSFVRRLQNVIDCKWSNRETPSQLSKAVFRSLKKDIQCSQMGWSWGSSGRSNSPDPNIRLRYGLRLRNQEQNKPHSLVCLAFKEQVELNLAWYRGISSISQTATSETFTRSSNIFPRTIQKQVSQQFLTIWDKERVLNKKLGFYNSVKGKLGIEEYIKEDISHKEW